MLTDEDAFRELFTRFGFNVDDVKTVVQGSGETSYDFVAKRHPKVLGYTDFVATFNFNADGSFKEMEVFE